VIILWNYCTVNRLCCEVIVLWIDCTVKWLFLKWLYCEMIVLWSDCTVNWLYCELVVVWNDCIVKWLFLMALWIDCAVKWLFLKWLYCEVIEPWSDCAVKDFSVKWLYREVIVFEVIVLWIDCTVKDCSVKWLYCEVTACPSSLLCSFGPVGFNRGFFFHIWKLLCVNSAEYYTRCHALRVSLVPTFRASSPCGHSCSTWSDELLGCGCCGAVLHLAVAGGCPVTGRSAIARAVSPPYRLLIEVWQSFDWAVADCWHRLLGRRSDQVAGQNSTVLTYCT
jgi:hypothetical protein